MNFDKILQVLQGEILYEKTTYFFSSGAIATLPIFAIVSCSSTGGTKSSIKNSYIR